MESEIRLQTHSINLMHMMTGIIPQNAIDEINKHIDSVVEIAKLELQERKIPLIIS